MKRLVILAAMASALSCGDGVKTGIFNDGLVNGLHYQTPTQQGLTTAKGEFKYKDGETVTFSIGGINLGSHKAEARVTPFDLAGVKLPPSEAELGPKLRHVGQPPFSVVANIAFMLYLLDADGNPTNGIDLTGLNDTLADAQLQFQGDSFLARLRMLATRFGLRDPASVPTGAPLQHLYDALGLHFKFHAQATRVLDAGNDGTVNERDSAQYDATTGMRTSATYDLDGDGTDDRSETYTYDANGRLLTDATTSTHGSEFDLTYTYTYTANGDTATALVVSHDANVLVQTDSVAYTYDAYGNDLGYQSSNQDNAGPDQTDSVTHTYDALGHAVTSDETKASGGVTTVHIVSSATYDATGDSTATYTTTSTPSAATDGNETDSATVNADGAATSIDQVFDYGNDGTVDAKTSSTWVYDGASGLNTQYISETTNGSGALQSRTQDDYTYDADGNLLTSDDRVDSNGDGTSDQVTHSVWTYDVFGNELTEMRTDDTNGDGTPNMITTITSTYDSDSNLVSRRADYDDDGNGTTDRSDVTTYTYVDVAGGVQGAMNRITYEQ